MSWLPGMSLGRRLTGENIVKMGELFAALHSHSRNWIPPGGFTSKKFDAYLSRGEPNQIFQHENLPLNDLKVLKLAQLRVRKAYADMDQNDLQVIHCDLWHENIKLYKGELFPFDWSNRDNSTRRPFRLSDLDRAAIVNLLWG